MPFLDFLRQGVLPNDITDTRRLVWRAKSYKLVDGQRYHRRTSKVLLRCISPEEGKKLLFDIHAGIYAHHDALRALVGKAFRHSFYWLTTLIDA